MRKKPIPRQREPNFSNLEEKLVTLINMCSTLLRETANTLQAFAQTLSELSIALPKIKNYYTVKEAAQYLSVSEVTIRRWISIGKLKSIKFQGKRLIPAECLVALSSKEN